MKKALLLFLVFSSVCALAQPNEKYLNEYVSFGIKNNLEYQSAKANTRVYESKLDQANSAYLPRLTASTRYTRAGGGRSFDFPLGDMLNPLYAALNLPTRLQNISESFTLPEQQDTKLELIQPLFNMAIYYASNSSGEQYNAIKFEQIAKAQNLALDIRSAYYSFLTAQALVDIRKNALRLATENYEVIRKIYEADRAPKADVLRAEVLRLTSRQELQAAINTMNLAQNSFNRILNREFNATINYDSLATADLIKDMDNIRFKTDIDESYKLALSLRPELHQLASNAKSIEHAEKAITSDYYPNLSLVGDLGVQGEKYKFDNESRYWAVTLAASWNIFSGFETKYKQEELDAQSQAIQLTSENLKNLIKLEINNDISVIRDNIEMLEVSAKSYESSLENYRLVSERYREGLDPLIKLIDAQTSLSATESSFIMLYYSILTAKSKLDKAIGRIDSEKINIK
jgi:outer membrane protein TolC